MCCTFESVLVDLKVMSRFYLSVICLFLVTPWSYGQYVSEYPEIFQLQSHMIPNQDPFLIRENKIVLAANYLNYIGTFSEVRQIAAQLGFNIKNKNRIGLSFQSYKEGSFISKNRVYGHYTSVVRLTRELNLSVGASFGLVNQSYLANSATEAVSKNSPDLSIGIGLEAKKTFFLFTSKQVLNHSFKPLSTDLVLKRYYQYYFTHLFPLNPYWNLAFLSYGDYYQDKKTDLYTILRANYEQKFAIGIGATSFNGILLYGQIRLKENAQGNMDFHVHYIIGEFIAKNTGSSVLEFGFLFSKK